MSYTSDDQSSDLSTPVELFRFEGGTRSYYMTSANRPFTYQTRTYFPVAGLSRSSIVSAVHTDDQDDLMIDIPSSSQLARDYALDSTPNDLSLTVYRMMRDSGDTVVYFNGIVSSFEMGAAVCKITVPSAFNKVLNDVFPSQYVQPPCNHILYDDRCKVARSLWSVNANVTAVIDRTITLDTLGGRPADFYKGGEILNNVTGERRSIVSSAGSTITINFEFSRITPGATVNVAAGCDRSYAGAGGCPKFANMLNFGGFPFVPGESNNPFTGGV